MSQKSSLVQYGQSVSKALMPDTMNNPKISLWWRDSNQPASGKTGAVQCEGCYTPCVILRSFCAIQ